MSGKQLSDNNPDGTSLGQSATDKIAFYGQVPVAQKASSVQSLGTTTTSAGGFNGVSVASSAWTATTQMAATLAEVVQTMIGLGLWKGAA